ncbi:SIS domain-containing protein [candidate division KSB1 bacterium]|nr:SIS domain-containing protein [candidate division KSB1 bacterium]
MNETKLITGLDKLQNAISDAAAMHSQLPSCFTELVAIATLCAKTLKGDGKLLFCGNGGSAAQAQHIATEFVVRLTAKRNRRALPAYALTADTTLLSACANDFGFERVFARQVEAFLKHGDVLFLLSTSGQSPNLIEAAQLSQALGGVNVAFLGQPRSPLDDHVHHALHIPAAAGQRVQEAHLLCGHMLVELIEDLLFEQYTPAEADRAVSKHTK